MAPFKRTRQPKLNTQALLSMDLGESSSDSDFRIEDHNPSDDEYSEVSKDDDDESDKSDDDTDDEETDHDAQSEASLKGSWNQIGNDNTAAAAAKQVGGLHNILNMIDAEKGSAAKPPNKPVCCVCLGSGEDTSEIIECDVCGVTVHEGCYGVSDNVSISSTDSPISTEPWFCEACRAGVKDPTCELCPNKGGIFKETDVGKWVHLVCALYVPGVAFGEVSTLSAVTLFEMPYIKWGAKDCSLCENSVYARTGVCIGCDAGMCKTYFHVTCAQAAGFLTETQHDDAADPFFAHCKVHSEKELMKKRRRNFLIYRMNMQQKQEEKRELRPDDPSLLRIQSRLEKYQQKYQAQKQLKSEPWVPTQKMSRLLNSSASLCNRLLEKAKVLSINVGLLEQKEAQKAALEDIHKKWHIPAAFSIDFVAYYLDRIQRRQELKKQLEEMAEHKQLLQQKQETLLKEYDSLLERNKKLKAEQEPLIQTLNKLNLYINTLCPNKNLPSVANIGRPHVENSKPALPPARPISVPTAAALKMGVGFPLAHLGHPSSKVDSTRQLSTHAKNSPNHILSNSTASTPTSVGRVQTQECGICKRSNDQHLLVKCDTCKLYYHLGCLNPPLTRPPKKSKLYGWQCSECDKSDESDPMPEILPKGPRRRRTRFNKDGSIALPNKSESANEDAKESVLMRGKRRRSMDSSPIDKQMRGQNANVSLPVSLESAAKAAAKTKAAAKAHNDTAASAVASKKARISNDSSDVALLKEDPLTCAAKLESTQNSDTDPLALPHASSVVDLTGTEDLDALAKQARKQKRKEKNRNKHSLSSDTDKTSNREHKRKRKKKLHYDEMMEQQSANTGFGMKKIKIKFKALPLPGEVTPEARYFYVPADAVRSAEETSRASSIETNNDSQSSPVRMPITATTPASAPAKVHSGATRRLNARAPTGRRSLNESNLKGAAGANAMPPPPMHCCICQQLGATTNAVTCDECKQHYHFTCLEPPLKKTPKIRGYSWHCADCDPTDEERL